MGIKDITGSLLLHSMLLLVMLCIVVWSPTLIGHPRLTLKDIGLQSMLQWRHIALGVIGFTVYLATMRLLTPLIKEIAWFNVDQTQDLGLSGMTGPTLFIGFIVLVIITPIVEEVLFRGVLQGKLRQAGVSFVVSALIVGALFAAAHGQWNVAIDVFFMSLVASYLRERTGKLWPSIIVHMLKNMLAFYVTFVLLSGAV